LGKEEEALVKLREVQELFLHQWCHHYSKVLLSSSTAGSDLPMDLTSFGKLMLKSAESSFLDFVIDKVFVQHILEFKAACQLLQKYSENHNKIQKFLEAVLSLTHVQQEDLEVARKLLLEIYLFRISELVIDKKAVVQESTLPCPARVHCLADAWLQHCSSQSRGGLSPKKTIQSILIQYCHHMQDLVLPDMLSVGPLREMLEEFTAKLPSTEDSPDIIPVRLTVLHLIGRVEEAVEIAARDVPSALEDYVKCVCQTDPDKWKCILTRICSVIRTTDATSDSLIATTFRRLLSDSLSVINPAELLTSLLPADGDTVYFLSVIRDLSYTLLSSQVHENCQKVFETWQ
jgi:hypothetical protein